MRVPLFASNDAFAHRCERVKVGLLHQLLQDDVVLGQEGDASHPVEYVAKMRAIAVDEKIALLRVGDEPRKKRVAVRQRGAVRRVPVPSDIEMDDVAHLPPRARRVVGGGII